MRKPTNKQYLVALLVYAAIVLLYDLIVVAVTLVVVLGTASFAQVPMLSALVIAALVANIALVAATALYIVFRK